MDVTFLNPFLDATTNLFKEMFSLEVKPDKPYVVGSQSAHAWAISGLLGLAGDAQGVVAVRLTRELAGILLEKSGVTVGSEKERKEMTGHLVGEITNIISGHATSRFQGKNVEIAPPVVISGENHQISWPPIGPVVGIPVSSSVGMFEIDVCLKT